MNSETQLTSLFPLRPHLPLPPGTNENQILEFLNNVCIEGAPEAEMRNYCNSDWRRFLYTYGLVHGFTGTALEIGANPYFTTSLLLRFTELKLTLTNYFDPTFAKKSAQKVMIPKSIGSRPELVSINFDHFNLEKERFPYEDNSFDVILLCEVIEHMQNDPLAALQEINRVLKPDGRLILTTPNVARLENIGRLISGSNIYDPYSGYGPYGRHNREFIMHELFELLKHAGFDLEVQFTADVHENHCLNYISIDDLKKIAPLLNFRKLDLGQYLFTRSIKKRASMTRKPSWLYRSYKDEQLC